MLKPGCNGQVEKPKPGREGATTWYPNSFRPGSAFATSMKEPGQPWRNRRGMLFGEGEGQGEWRKCMSRGSKEGRYIVVVYWGRRLRRDSSWRQS